MEQKFQLAKNYNFAADLQLENYVDAKDTVNHWCVGQVCDVDEDKNTVKIHFEGWTQRYDEVMKKNSQKLAPFRRYTEGYTGQKKSAFRDFKMNYTQNNYMLKRVRETIEKDFTNFDTPYALTQFIRGELYFYIDSLISLFNSTNSEDIPAIFEFMQEVFKLILKWMEIFPNYLKSFNECQQHPQLYLVDYEAAVSQCGNELFSIFEKCFGLCPRSLKFFQRFGNELIYEGEKTYASKDKTRGQGLMVSFLNAFGNNQGFEAILQFIKFEQKDSKGKMVNSCPLILTMRALRPFIEILLIGERSFVIQFVKEVRQALTERLDNLQDNEIKELDKDILKDIIDVLKSYISIIEPENAFKTAEQYELIIAQKYLRCPFFEKRVRGINELKEIFYKVANSQQRNKQQLDAAGKEYTKWLTVEEYARWIIEQRIIPFIFVENPHVELIKRSYELLTLLAVDEKTFSPEIIDMMWVCCREKHEDIVRATLDLVQEIAYKLPLDRLAQLFSRICSIKESEFDEKTVTFLKNYTLSAMKNVQKNRKVESSKSQGSSMANFLTRTPKRDNKLDDANYYDLVKFWQIIQDQNKVGHKVKDLALNSLTEILTEYNDKDQKEFFIILALENIKKGDSFLNSIIFLRKILNSYPLDSQMRFKPTQTTQAVSQVLTDIAKKYDLYDIIITNTFNYMSQAQQSAKKFSLNSQVSGGSSSNVLGNTGEKIQSQQLVGHVTHEDYIKIIFSFIEFVLINSKLTLSSEHISKMFDMFVLKPISEFETNIFFALLTKENEQAKSKERRYYMDDKVRSDVFQKIFCNNNILDCEKMNWYGFLCFKKLFLIVNEEEKQLELLGEDKASVNNLNQLHGIETLWRIAIECQNQKVKVNCKDFLVDLYLKAKTKTNAQRNKITELFTSNCLQFFKASHDRGDHQLNCLKLIKTFISRFDGDHILEEDMTQYGNDPKDIKEITITLNPDKITNKVRVHLNQKFWQLKRKIATAFKLRLSEFYIRTKQGPLEERIYDELIKDYSVSQIQIQRVPQEEMEREFPRYLIGYNQDYLSMFVELLQMSNEEISREVLTLLEILPTNLEIKIALRDNIIKFAADSTIADWEKVFSWNGTDLSKTVYFLMVLEDMMIPRRETANQEALQQEAQLKAEFVGKILQKNGFFFIFNLYCTLDKSNLERDTLKTKALTLLLKIISHLFNQKQFSSIKQSLSTPNIENLINQTLTIIESFIQTAKHQQINGILPGEERVTRQLQNDVSLLQNSLSFLIKVIGSFQHCIDTLYNFKGYKDMFRTALIDIESELIQRQTMNAIKEICIKLELSSDLDQKPSFFFMALFIQDCLEYSLKVAPPSKTKVFFELLNHIMCSTEVYQQLHLIKPIGQLVSNVCDMIVDREIIEFSARDEDVTLSGLMVFLRNLLEKFPENRESFEEKNRLLKYLTHDCLFHKETKAQLINKHKAMPPKCKHNATRENCLRLIHMLTINNTEGIQVLIRYLKHYIGETFWRTPRKVDWAITVHQQERSLTGFVGLKNIGCICYMNCIMQQLYMIPTFRKALIEVEDGNFTKDVPEENPLHQLKMIFGSLMESEKQYYNPKRFCGAFKDIDGSPMDPTVQKDVDEFFNMLIDRIENLIKGKKEEKIIKNLFQGVFANEFICKGCPHYSEREEPFLAISLQVKNKHSIKESLEAFVEGEMLEGDNAYFCEKCEKKVNTLKRCCIKRMPNVLILVLKRFEFNFDTMSKFKINDLCEFPMNLNMYKFSQENLQKQDLIKEMEDKNLTQSDLNDDQKSILGKQLPQKYYDYNLKGTVIHLGTADQGHYYSFIQDRENEGNKWYEFNDHLIKDFDPSEIPYEAFGGEDESLMNDLQSMKHLKNANDQAMIQAMKQYKTKIKNAYVLIYEREEIIDMEKFNEFVDNPNVNTNKQEIAYKYEQCKLPKTVSSQIQIQPAIHDTALEENKKFWLSKFIFNKIYIDSVLNIFKEIVIVEDMDYERAKQQDLQTWEGGQFEMYRFLTTFFLTTVIRAKERASIPHFMKIIRLALKNNVALSLWLLEIFSNQDLIKELLVDCPIPDMKRFTAGLLKTAMQTVYQFEQEALQEYCNNYDQDPLEYIRMTQASNISQVRVVDSRQPPTKGEQTIYSQCSELPVFHITKHNKQLPILIVFINSYAHMGVSFHNMRNFWALGQFYMVFAHFVELGPVTRLYLLKIKTVGRLLDLFLNGDNSKQQPNQVTQKFRNESLQKVPLFIFDKDLYIESNLLKVDVKITDMERKNSMSTATQCNMFLLYTVSILARSCIFVKTDNKNPLANDDLNFVLDQDEMSLLIDHHNESWWINCLQKVPRNAVANMYAHIAFENKEFSQQYLVNLVNMINKTTFDYLRAYERPLLKLIQIQDSYQTDRVKKTIQGLFDVMKSNTTYYKFVDSIIELIFKLTQRCPTMVEQLNKNNVPFRFIEQWTKENPFFPLNQQRIKIFKAGIVQWNNKPNLINQQLLDRIQLYCKERLQKLWKTIQKELPTVEDTYDSDDDMFHREFAEKEKVDFSNQMENWYTGFIEISMDEMVRCVSETEVNANGTPLAVWIETESDKLAPSQTLVSSEKRKTHQFYLTLLKSVNQVGN